MTAVPNRLPSQQAAQPFVVELERFQGPLDLLLHLIRSQDIDIFDIPISRITHQFHEALASGADRLELDRAGEFIELAATLVRIKAHLLLPGRVDPDWEDDPRAELVRRLLEYELFQEIARLLGTAELHRRRHLGKGFLPPPPAREREGPELATTLEDLLAVVADMPEPEPVARHLAPIRRVTVEEKTATVRRLLGTNERVPFTRLFTSWRERHHVVAALLACLELARQQVLRIEQTKRFGAIWLFGRRPGRAGAGDGDG